MDAYFQAKVVAQGPVYLEHAGDLTGPQLGVDDNGVVWMCVMRSNGSLPTTFGARNIGYPCAYHGPGQGPRVRLLRHPVTIEVHEASTEK